VNFLDNAISAVAPGWALRRQVARKRIELLDELRAYDGAAQGRRLKNWNASATDADAEIAAGGQRLRDRARDLVRNNAHAAKAVSVLADNLVGDGIIPRANTGDPQKDKEINRLFDIFARNCDPSRRATFYTKQYQAVRGMVEGGEMLGRKLVYRPKIVDPDNPVVGLQIQLLEPDFLDTTKTSAKGKQSVIGGIVFDQKGARTGYWLRGKHPGSSNTTGASSESTLVKADEIVHLYESQRDSVRGASWLAPAIVTMRDADEYDQAEIVRKKIEACVVAIVTPGEDDPNDTGITAKVTDANGNILERFEPGVIAYSRGGKQINFNNPSVSAGYEPFNRTMLRKIAAGLRIPYEFLTGDLSTVNFSSARVGIIEFRRFIRAVQNHFIIPQFCQPIWDWFIEVAQLQGLIEDGVTIPVKWVPPKFEFINPIDDVKADILAIRAGLKSWKDVVSSYGYDPDEVLDEIAAVNLLLDDFGIILDSDPRYTTQQGLAQMSSDVGDGEADPEEGDKPTEGKKPAAAAKPAAKTTPKKAPAKKPAAKQKVAA
jgi:lambda family phage portal protein